MSTYTKKQVLGEQTLKGREAGVLIQTLSAIILLAPHIEKQFMYTQMCLKFELCVLPSRTSSG